MTNAQQDAKARAKHPGDSDAVTVAIGGCFSY